MSLSKQDFRGTGKIFSFTLRQMMKNKGNIVSVIILVLMAVISVPAMTLLGGGGVQEEQVLYAEADYEELGVTQDQLDMFYADYEVHVQTLEEYRNPTDMSGAEAEDPVDVDARYWLQLMYSIVVMMLSVMSISYIVRTVVEEKASKLVELLMVSVRPMALIIGKILAAMAFVFGMFVLVIGGYVLSYIVTGMFLDVSAIGGSLSAIGVNAGLLSKADLPAVISIVISLLTGYLTFSIIAGMFASGCSSTAEMDGATMPPTMIIMAGYIVSCAASAIEGGPAAIVLSLCPIVSVFCAPVQYLLGNISFLVLTLAWIQQLIVVILLFWFCAKIYNELIIYKGGRIGMKQMIAMAKTGGKGGHRK